MPSFFWSSAHVMWTEVPTIFQLFINDDCHVFFLLPCRLAILQGYIVLTDCVLDWRWHGAEPPVHFQWTWHMSKKKILRCFKKLKLHSCSFLHHHLASLTWWLQNILSTHLLWPWIIYFLTINLVFYHHFANKKTEFL